MAIAKMPDWLKPDSSESRTSGFFAVTQFASVTFRIFVAYETVAMLAALANYTLNSEQVIPLVWLPFVNLSDEAGQAFFSDGITEEILALLAKQPGLWVISRTSSFTLKDSKLDVRAIAQKLDEALDLLERRIKMGGLCREWVQRDADFDGMRNNPRFQALLMRMSGPKTGG